MKALIFAIAFGLAPMVALPQALPPGCRWVQHCTPVMTPQGIVYQCSNVVVCE